MMGDGMGRTVGKPTPSHTSSHSGACMQCRLAQGCDEEEG